MAALREAEVDEALLMARYISATGGLWPHLPRHLAQASTSLQRGRGSPMGSWDAHAHAGAQPRAASHGWGEARGDPPGRWAGEGDAAGAGSAEEPQEAGAGEADAACSGHASRLREGAALPAVATAHRHSLASTDTRCLGRRSRGGPHLDGHQGLQPQIRVLDFHVSSDISSDSSSGDSLAPATGPPSASRAAMRSALSSMLNAPA